MKNIVYGSLTLCKENYSVTTGFICWGILLGIVWQFRNILLIESSYQTMVHVSWIRLFFLLAFPPIQICQVRKMLFYPKSKYAKLPRHNLFIIFLASSSLNKCEKSERPAHWSRIYSRLVKPDRNIFRLAKTHVQITWLLDYLHVLASEVRTHQSELNEEGFLIKKKE